MLKPIDKPNYAIKLTFIDENSLTILMKMNSFLLNTKIKIIKRKNFFLNIILILNFL